MTATAHPLQIYQQVASAVPPGTYPVLDGVPGQSIHITDYMVSSTAGTTTYSDTNGNVLLIQQGNAQNSDNWLNATLALGVGLQVTCTQTTDLNVNIEGYIA